MQTRGTNVFDEPFDIKRTVSYLPVAKGFVLIEIDVGSHLHDAREVAARVYGEEGIFFAVSSSHSSLQF